MTSSPMSSGSSSSPDSVADTPCTSCRYCGRKASAPNIATPLTNAMMLATVKICSLNRLQRQDRLRRRRLADREADEHQRAQHEQPDDLPRSPRVVGAAGLRGEQDARDAGHQEQRAPPVDLHLAHAHGQLQHPVGHDERDDAQRQVDVEDVAPAQAVDGEPARERADHARDAEHGAEVALVAAALARRDHVADDREDQRDQATAADALQPAEGDQLVHVLRRRRTARCRRRKTTMASWKTRLRP